MEVDLSTIYSKEDRVKLYLKCKLSPLFFIENFVSVEVAGGKIAIKDSSLWHSNPTYRQLIQGLHTFDSISFLASRQHGKTQSIAMYLLWILLFHPNIQIEFVTLDSKRAADFVKRIKFMLAELPKWLQMPFKGKAERVTYIELENGARLNSNYISGSISPDQVGRGLSSPVIYLDEAAFIPKMSQLITALIPAQSAAARFAKQNNYPQLIVYSSTPNGAGENYLYQLWQRGVDSSELFEKDTIKVKEDYQEIIDSYPETNGVVKFKIHWSSTDKDEAWYQKQCRSLNWDRRKISQELDLVFLGSSNATFSDEVLEQFEPQTPTSEITMAYGESFKLTQEIDSTRTYLLGVDSAATRGRNSDWSAMALTDAQTGEEVGVWHGRFSVIKRYAVVVKSLIQGLNALHGLDDDTLKVVIERNSFGLGVVEELLYDEADFDYASYVYYETRKNGERIPGLTTTAVSRDMMFNLLLSNINEMPSRATSYLFQEELRNLEQKNSGKFEAQSGAHDDIIMAYNFTLYVREEMIKDGLIVTDGRVDKYDIKRASYFLDVTMSNSDAIDKMVKPNGETFKNINNDEVSDRKRILKEQGLSKDYEKMPGVDDAVIFGVNFDFGN